MQTDDKTISMDPYTIGENTPLLDDVVVVPGYQSAPSRLGAIVFGVVVIGTWLGLLMFVSEVYPAAANLLAKPVTFSGFFHILGVIVTLPGIIHKVITKDKNTLLLPWSILSEFLFVCLVLLVWVFINKAPCTRNICEIAFSLNIALVVLMSIPWLIERIDIIGGIFALLLGVGTGLVLANEEAVWTIDDLKTYWPQFVTSFGFTIVFALYCLSLRKSSSSAMTTSFMVVFVHLIAGSFFSGAGALIEVFPNPSNWTSLFGEVYTGTNDIWKIIITLVFGFLYKISITLTSRHSELHTLAFAAHIGVVLGVGSLKMIPIFTLAINNATSAADFFKQYPRECAGLILMGVSLIYWFVRIARLPTLVGDKRRATFTD